MYFNSIAFGIFLPVVWVLYWFVMNRSLKAQNLLLLVASYVFYGWWDWRFLSLIAASSLLDYFVAIRMDVARLERIRKWLLAISLMGNLGMLALFKYYDFFALALVEAFATAGVQLEPRTLGWILPVGISFYTFQTLSYSIDVYRRQLAPSRDPIAFLAYVSFFPQLVAGPIERAINLLPQFRVPRQFDPGKASDGMRQILWGFFKKVVIADACAPIVDQLFDPSNTAGASSMVWGIFLFAIQIYCDFSGYSDIAIGVGRLFGFELMRNFAFPYFSRDIAEFWRRWHISLNTWFRDYVYIPLGGSRSPGWGRIRNILVVFLLSGLWHGANWTYLAWGAINAALFIPILLLGSNRRNLDTVASGRWLPNLRELGQILSTFSVTLLAWVFFRAESVEHAVAILGGLLSPSLTEPIYSFNVSLFWSILLLVSVEWLQREKVHGLDVAHLPSWARRSLYGGILLMIFFLGRFSGTDFIYFQF